MLTAISMALIINKSRIQPKNLPIRYSDLEMGYERKVYTDLFSISLQVVDTPENILNRSNRNELIVKHIVIPTSWLCLMEKELNTGILRKRMDKEDITRNILSLISVLMVRRRNLSIILIF